MKSVFPILMIYTVRFEHCEASEKQQSMISRSGKAALCVN